VKTFEINFGLQVGTDEFSAENTLGQITERANAVERQFRHLLSTVKVRREWGDEPTLVIQGRASTDDPGGFHQWLHNLCETFRQDCVAVYYPEEDKGYLVGPNADEWGEFNLDYFTRY
jgi:hypothetical protein